MGHRPEMKIEPWADDVPLIGPGSPKVEMIDDLLNYLATIRSRFGNTTITFRGTWGASALWACDSLTRERDEMRQLVDMLHAALSEWVKYFDDLNGQNPGDPLAAARELYHGKRLEKSRAALMASAPQPIDEPEKQ